MKLTRKIPQFRSFKFTPFAIAALFLFTNLTGFLFNLAFAPDVKARAIAQVFDPNYIPADVPSSGDHELDLLIVHAGERYGVDPRLLHAVIWKESNYKTNALSHMGAQGLMQMIPATAKRFGCTDLTDAESNLDAGAQYLRFLLKRFDGDVSLALAAYNAGEGAVDKYNGVPPYNETQNYVSTIVARYGKTFHPILEPDQALTEFHLEQEVAQVAR
jgi:soluble lytic murein transglycosylase-like protein